MNERKDPFSKYEDKEDKVNTRLVQNVKLAKERYPELAKKNYPFSIDKENTRLVQNVKLAKKAVIYALDAFAPTNVANIEGGNAKKNEELNAEREAKNEKLADSYLKLKQKRESINYPVFEKLEAYEKGVGINIRMWDAHGTKSTLTRKQPGNCSEMTNAAFAFLYKQVYEMYRENNIAEDHLARIVCVDVEDGKGGHSFLLIDPDPSIFKMFKVNTLYNVAELLSNLGKFGANCVVVDPWNKYLHFPFYPMVDSERLMPDCAKSGTFKFKFGLTLENQTKESETPTLSREAPTLSRKIG